MAFFDLSANPSISVGCHRPDGPRKLVWASSSVPDRPAVPSKLLDLPRQSAALRPVELEARTRLRARHFLDAKKDPRGPGAYRSGPETKEPDRRSQ